MGEEKVEEILKKHFKTLYDFSGMKWTSDNEKDIERLVNGLEELIEEKVNTFAKHDVNI